VVGEPAAKRALRMMTDGLVVDLESAAAAGFAASRFLKASSGRRYDRRPLTGAGTRSV
jgi:hypothetical protein